MSAKDLSGRLLVPVMARPRRPLSSNASTASCSMRFSLRTMMSGAFNSSKRRSRLLRLMPRRYRSFKSEVAKRPPSSGTNGRRSGGSTGRTVSTIHSGLLPDSMNPSINLNRFGAHARVELVAVLFDRLEIHFVGQQLAALQGGHAGVDDHKGFEVQHA